MSKRKLTSEEIDYICEGINNSHPDNFVGENAKIVLRQQLTDIELYPQLIDEFKKKISEAYSNSIISPSEMVGCIASTSIGETTTQASLNSVEKNTRILIEIDGKKVTDTIGNLIDNEFEKNEYLTLTYKGQVEYSIANPYAQVLDMTAKDWIIPSINNMGISMWKKVTQLIRHPLYTGLIRVTTQSGRTVDATTGLSFLVYKNGQILPVNGNELEIGNLIPITWKNSLYVSDTVADIRYEVFNDVFLDPIISIQSIDTNTWVYDFTVEDTYNFQLENGMNVRDSFHSSGQAKAHLTSGVDRLKELLGASKEVKTPSLTIVFDVPIEQRKKLKKVRELTHQHIEFYTFADICVSYEIQKLEDIEYEDWYEFFDIFYGDSYKQCDIRIRAVLDKEKLWKIRKSLENIVYCLNGSINPSDELYFVFSPMEEFIIDIWCCSDNVTSVDQILNPKVYSPEQIQALSTYVDSVSMGEFFLKFTVLPAILRTHISGLLDVERCYYSETKEYGWIVETKGGYMVDMWHSQHVNLLHSRSNNVWEVYKLLGIEAVVKFLQEEFSKIISVSKRHLDVMIDWMTSTGGISSVSRYGVDIAKVGPLAKASFEQPLDAFFEAAHNAQKEIITGVSAAVATGNLANMGTGGFSLMFDLRRQQEIREEMNMIDAEIENNEIVVANVNTANAAVIDEIEDFMEYEIEDDNGEQY